MKIGIPLPNSSTSTFAYSMYSSNPLSEQEEEEETPLCYATVNSLFLFIHSFIRCIHLFLNISFIYKQK